jgi:4-amino-4-deoxy-L-arabinose transferase-like glycosyltransferase
MNNSTFVLSRFHLVAASIFILLNLIAHSFSFPDAIYVHGADASRYYNSALSLANGDGFGNILATGPVYPTFLAIHYFALGFDYGNILLVISQSLLLYITGFVTGKLSIKLFAPINAWVVLFLVIFNPNSLITAHLVQTETIFTLFFIGYLYSFLVLFKQGKNLLLFAFLALLISLTRPAGMYVMFVFFLPSIIFVVNNTISWQRFFFINVVYYLILGIGLSLWALNNNYKYGEFFISANQTSVLNDQYIALMKYGKGMSQIDAANRADEVYQNVVAEKNLTCSRDNYSLGCRDDTTKAYIDAIFNEKPGVLIKAVSTSVINVMVSGGASNFANYFGIENKNAINAHEKTVGGKLSYEKAVNFIKSVNIKYFFALVVFWGFSILIKILMIFGIWSIFKNSINREIILALSFFVLFFIAEFMFLGQSRWRVPLDPFIIILASQGIYYILNTFKKN